MPFYTIQIQKNLNKDEIITKKAVQLDLTNITITPTTSNGGRNNVYQFRSGDYTFKWEQNQKGGVVEIFKGEELVKEINY